MKKIRKNTVRHTLPLTNSEACNLIKAHEATGQTLMHEHVEKMKKAVNKVIQVDDRFTTQKPNPDNVPMRDSYLAKPYCFDVTTPDEKGCHHAIISKANGELVRHGFDFNHDLGTCKMCDGDSKPTERTSIYARETERHENMMRATHELISCRASNGSELIGAKDWVANKPVKFIYVPAGISTISAGFRKNETITCTVVVDEETPADLQESFDNVCATEPQEPFADEEHAAKKATLRFPKEKVKFTYGSIKGRAGVVVDGPEPTSYGAECANGKVYASWSPEFGTDADYAKAICKKGHYTFPDGVRGSASNPARLIAIGFVTGAMTNKPAFRNMPPVKAKLAELDGTDTTEAETVTATWSDAARAAAIDALHNHKGTHVIYNDGRDGHKGVKGKILDRDEHGMRVHFEDRARPTHISYKSDEWVKHTKPHHDESTKATDAAAADTVQAAAAAAADLSTKSADEKGNAPAKTTITATSPLDEIAARQAADIEWLNKFAMKSPEVRAQVEASQKKPAEVVSTMLARQQDARDFEATLLTKNPAAANHDLLKKLEAQTI